MLSSSRCATRRNRRATALFVAILVAAPSAVASAEPPPAPPLSYPTYVTLPGAGLGGIPTLPGPPLQKTWYGWQTLYVLGGATTLGFVSALSGGLAGSDVVVLGGVSVAGAGILLGGPIVHWAHGHVGRGFGVLGMNLGMPLVSGGVGALVACSAGACGRRGHETDIAVGFVVGGGLGLIASLVLDVSLFAREPTVPASSDPPSKVPEWTFVPDIAISRSKTTFGFAGVF